MRTVAGAQRSPPSSPIGVEGLSQGDDGAEVLGDAVLHHLHAGGVEAAVLSGAVALLDVGYPFEAAFAVPPQSADVQLRKQQASL
ncbi:hypothetical protein ACFWP3_07795 [Streptomyces sp. NPDC058525]|uniref:hypothetical protein n=1 Tax=Streptomyces sp. NPDC058525 TaxID=3346538 RepID=UPI003650C9B9